LALHKRKFSLKVGKISNFTVANAGEIQCFFLGGANFAQKRNSKLKNEVILEVFKSPEVKKNNSKNHQIFIFDCHIIYTFQWMNTNLAKNINSL
jgi:hypothetical protein